MDTDLMNPAALVQPTVVVPAAIARHVPPPQPVFVPAGSAAAPGVVIGLDGVPYYGHPPVTYAQPSPLADPQAVQGIVRAAHMAGSGVFAAGAGFGINEAMGALAGASTGTVLMMAALVVASRTKAPRQIINHIREENQYHQHFTAIARGMFSRVTGSNDSDSSKTVNNTMS